MPGEPVQAPPHPEPHTRSDLRVREWGFPSTRICLYTGMSTLTELGVEAVRFEARLR